MKKRVTIHDVCQEARVSIATVSNVLNGRRKVSETTRKRVLEAVERLDFTPSAAARNLSRSKTDTIGVVLPIFSGFYGRLLSGVQEETGPAGLYLLTIGVEDLDKTFEAIDRLISQRRVDGVLVYSPILSPQQVKSLLQSSIPVVAGERPVEGPALPAVLYDNFKIGYEATRHLIEHGHERIATLTGPLKWRSARERLRGYEAALRDFGLRMDRELVVEGNWLEEPSSSDFIAHFRDRPWPQAVFAASDQMALGLLRYARHHRNPEVRATAIVSFDDIEPSSIAGLTTLCGPIEALGKRMASVLLELLEKKKDKKTPFEVVVPVQLIKRSSCGCADSAVP